jgi:hypothetical protein
MATLEGSNPRSSPCCGAVLTFGAPRTCPSCRCDVNGRGSVAKGRRSDSARFQLGSRAVGASVAVWRLPSVVGAVRSKHHPFLDCLQQVAPAAKRDVCGRGECPILDHPPEGRSRDAHHLGDFARAYEALQRWSSFPDALGREGAFGRCVSGKGGANRSVACPHSTAAILHSSGPCPASS